MRIDPPTNDKKHAHQWEVFVKAYAPPADIFNNPPTEEQVKQMTDKWAGPLRHITECVLGVTTVVIFCETCGKVIKEEMTGKAEYVKGLPL